MTAAVSHKTDIFGVCTRAGADLGLHPDILRVGFAIGVFFAPAIAIAVYATLGAAVALGRWLFPARTPASVTVLPTPAAAEPIAFEPLREAA